MHSSHEAQPQACERLCHDPRAGQVGLIHKPGCYARRAGLRHTEQQPLPWGHEGMLTEHKGFLSCPGVPPASPPSTPETGLRRATPFRFKLSVA